MSASGAGWVALDRWGREGQFRCKGRGQVTPRPVVGMCQPAPRGRAGMSGGPAGVSDRLCPQFLRRWGEWEVFEHGVA